MRRTCRDALATSTLELFSPETIERTRVAGSIRETRRTSG